VDALYDQFDGGRVDFEDFDDTDMSTFDTFETMFGKLFDNGAVVADALTRIARVRSKLRLSY